MIARAALLPGTFDAHAILREATHETHLRLHGLPQFAAIAAERLTRGAYADLLQALRRFHGAVARAAEHGGLAALSSSRRRLDLLEADLGTLGAAPSRIASAWTSSPGACLYGALYVAEGSALGGKVIARQLDYLLGDRAEGRTFFRGDGDIGPRWRAFLAALQRDCGEGELPQLVAGAEAGFALFERCLAE